MTTDLEAIRARDRAGLGSGRAEMQAAYDALAAENAALRKDAERYRWLRDRWFMAGDLLPWETLPEEFGAADCDAAIDAALEG